MNKLVLYSQNLVLINGVFPPISKVFDSMTSRKDKDAYRREKPSTIHNLGVDRRNSIRFLFVRVNDVVMNFARCVVVPIFSTPYTSVFVHDAVLQHFQHLWVK